MEVDLSNSVKFIFVLKIIMEFHDGSLHRFVKFWIATTITLFLVLVLASQRWPPLDAMMPSPWRATKQNSRNSNEDAQSNFAGLAELLPMVATDDRTVIITSVNEAFARSGSLLGLFRESFFAGEKIDHFLNHLLVVAMDPMAYRHCRTVHRFCYLLPTTKTSMDLSSASDFMSDAYVALVWTKLELQQRVLQLGYSFLFTDVDILWFRDPFRHIGVHADMATSCDVFSGDADDLSSWPNTGFYYVKATNRTVEMLRRWRAARRRFPRNHEQTIFNNIKHELAGAGSDLRIRVQFLDTARFGGFCQLFRNDMARACTMHANCCIGMANKVSDLRDVLGQWRNYTVMAPAEKMKAKAAGRSFEWRVPAKCGTPDKRP
ncbi:hypothetical protein CFC21_049445 [Triticum aestivum]|uniref:Nucleotide-diphospho-sugar transferase domain-containing protein n=3 Tax=Triticinae TaxID=1648030 RepID=A0A9R1G3U7_WHEAT|nr:hypothetical protein CFC21_049445 [Triticum aestivum]